jgi:hypothetical protein
MTFGVVQFFNVPILNFIVVECFFILKIFVHRLFSTLFAENAMNPKFKIPGYEE